jgi:hypothetical protein
VPEVGSPGAEPQVDSLAFLCGKLAGEWEGVGGGDKGCRPGGRAWGIPKSPLSLGACRPMHQYPLSPGVCARSFFLMRPEHK